MTEENETEEVRDPQALLASYNKAKQDLIDSRNELKSLQAELEALKTSDMRLKALSAEAKLALQEQGIKDVDRLMPYVGTDGLDFDDKGKVTGLTERLEQLKKDLPEIFDAKRRAGGKADIYADTAAQPEVDPLRQAVRAALNH